MFIIGLATKKRLHLVCRKDPNAFFSFPVTDLIAPGYSSVIKRPMDFSTMKDRVKKECYQSLDELKVPECITNRALGPEMLRW